MVALLSGQAGQVGARILGLGAVCSELPAESSRQGRAQARWQRSPSHSQEPPQSPRWEVARPTAPPMAAVAVELVLAVVHVVVEGVLGWPEAIPVEGDGLATLGVHLPA